MTETKEILQVEHVRDVQLTALQKVMVGVATAFALWLGMTVYTTAVTVAVMQAQIKSLVDNNEDRYTASMAALATQTQLAIDLKQDQEIARLRTKHDK